MSPPSLIAALVVSLIVAGCGGPPDATGVTGPGPAAPALTPTEGPSGPTFPEPLRAEAITDITSSCRAGQDGAVASIEYRSRRAGGTDDVQLTLQSDNGYVQLTHRRGGQQLGVTIVDVVLSSDPVFPPVEGRQGHGQAALMAELPAPGLRPALMAAGVCLSQSMEGKVTRDDQVFVYLPSCDFAEGVMDSVLAAALEGAARACCASAPGNLSCEQCRAGASAAQQIFDRDRASAPPPACDTPEQIDDAR